MPTKDTQIELPIKLAHSADKQEVSIKLYPETLGRVDVKIKYSADRTGAMIENIRISASENSIRVMEISSIELKKALEHLLSDNAKANEQAIEFSARSGNNNTGQDSNQYNPYQNDEDRDHWMRLFSKGYNEPQDEADATKHSNSNTNIDLKV